MQHHIPVVHFREAYRAILTILLVSILLLCGSPMAAEPRDSRLDQLKAFQNELDDLYAPIHVFFVLVFLNSSSTTTLHDDPLAGASVTKQLVAEFKLVYTELGQTKLRLTTLIGEVESDQNESELLTRDINLILAERENVLSRARTFRGYVLDITDGLEKLKEANRSAE